LDLIHKTFLNSNKVYTLNIQGVHPPAPKILKTLKHHIGR
jgi:hypothetical protein